MFTMIFNFCLNQNSDFYCDTGFRLEIKKIKMACSSNRSMWSTQNPLRKQKSCMDATLTSTKLSVRSGRPMLQKQMSVDQGSLHRQQLQLHLNAPHQNYSVSSNANVNSDESACENNGLRIFAAVKKRMQHSSVDHNNELVPSIFIFIY